MGSFAASVDLPENLRPLAHAGLELLFLPGGVPSGELTAAETSTTPSAKPADAEPNSQDPAPDRSADPGPESWPAPWSVLASRVRTAPRAIITYASLADDVTGAADPARRKLFQTILAYLAWPQGTTLFWPISFPKGVEPGALFAADVFAAGVRHYEVRHIICFGTRPAERAVTLFPQEGKTPPVLVHQAPEPEALVSMLPHELHKVLAFLKSIQLV